MSSFSVVLDLVGIVNPTATKEERCGQVLQVEETTPVGSVRSSGPDRRDHVQRK
jgi:hypothetical protein